MLTRCYHCGEPVPDGHTYALELDGQLQQFCCPGCRAVAQTISEGGLGSYYQHRTQVNQRIDEQPAEARRLALYDLPEVQTEFVRSDGGEREAQLSIEGITCAACAWLIERHLAAVPGVIAVAVNTSTARARLRWRADQVRLSELMTSIVAIGYQALPFQPHRQEASLQRQKQAYLYRLGVAGLGSMQVMMVALGLYAGFFQDMEREFQLYFRWVSLLLATPVLLYSAQPFYLSAWRSLRHRHLNMDVPVSAALLGAYFASLYATLSGSGEIYFESVSMFTFFLLLGRYLELQVRQKATQASANLSKLIPQLAIKLEQGEEREVLSRHLQPGDLVRVLPGAWLPADGLIREGTASLDEAMLTGESLPVLKSTGAAVYAGTINTDSPLVVCVTQPPGQTLADQIMRLQDQALSEKPRLAQLADQAAGYFVVGLLLLASLTYAYWSRQDPEQAFWICLSVLVATCPCALALATPTALTASLARLADQGVLICKGHVLECLPRISRLILDKTGTLTEGRFKLQAVHSLGSLPTERLLSLAGALELGSEHPLAQPFRAHARPETVARQLQAYPGQGISGEIDGETYRIGHLEWLGLPAPEAPVAGRVSIYLADAGQLLGAFVLEDCLRPDAHSFVEQVRARGLKLSLLTGDPSDNGLQLANALGIPEVIRGARPADKLACLQRWQQDGEITLMIGDGVNDAPVLAGAHVSFAMATGTDLAKTSADGILLGNQLLKIPYAMDMARQTRRIIRQNLLWALGYNLLVVPLAVSGHLPPYLAAIGMSLSSLLVVGNSMRLNRL